MDIVTQRQGADSVGSCRLHTLVQFVLVSIACEHYYMYWARYMMITIADPLTLVVPHCDGDKPADSSPVLPSADCHVGEYWTLADCHVGVYWTLADSLWECTGP